MAENTTEVVVGGAVLAVALGFLVYAGQATGFVRDSGSYEVWAAFQAVDGVSVGTDVRLAGVKIGAVTSIALNPQTYYADTRFTVRKDIELPEDTTAVVSSEGLMGGNFIELLPGGALENLGPGDEIEDTQGSVSLTGLLMKFVGGSAEQALTGGVE